MANQASRSTGDLSLPIWKDLFFSLLLHVLVFALLVTLALWKKQQRVEPLMRIEVSIISNKQLATLQQLAHPVSRAKGRSVQAKLEPVEAKSIHTPQVAPKPVMKPKPGARPVLKPEPLTQPTAKLQAAAEMETVLKPKTLSKPTTLPSLAAEPIVNLEQASKPVIKLAPAMKPVVSFKSASRPLIRLNTPAKPAVIAKPVLKLKPPPVIKSEPETDPDYDPFAPMESASHQQHRSRTMKSVVRELTGDTKKQLSQKEINRYIKGMQRAVEKHWKIAVTVEHVKDPLVEMVLLPGGRIKSLRILESSGNATVNASLIRAIHAAAPFELPKQQFEYFRINRIRFHPFK